MRNEHGEIRHSALLPLANLHTGNTRPHSLSRSRKQKHLISTQGSDLYDREVHDRMVKAAFDFCEAEARRHDVPMPAGLPPPPANEAGSSADHGAAPDPAPEPAPATAVVTACSGKTKPPIPIQGTFKASLGPAQTEGRKTFAVSVPWQPQFQLGASCAFTHISDGIPKISWQLSSDPASSGRATNLSFSLPIGFQPNEVTLTGLQITQFAKKKAPSKPPPPPPPASNQQKRANPAPQPGPKKKQTVPVPGIPADAVFAPPEGTTILACPPTVDAASLKGKLIAHRFDKAAWAEVWATGGKALRRSADSDFFEVKYPGYRELYLHSLDASAYGPDKTWCLYG